MLGKVVQAVLYPFAVVFRPILLAVLGRRGVIDFAFGPSPVGLYVMLAIPVGLAGWMLFWLWGGMTPAIKPPSGPKLTIERVYCTEYERAKAIEPAIGTGVELAGASTAAVVFAEMLKRIDKAPCGGKAWDEARSTLNQAVEAARPAAAKDRSLAVNLMLAAVPLGRRDLLDEAVIDENDSETRRIRDNVARFVAPQTLQGDQEAAYWIRLDQLRQDFAAGRASALRAQVSRLPKDWPLDFFMAWRNEVILKAIKAQPGNKRKILAAYGDLLGGFSWSAMNARLPMGPIPTLLFTLLVIPILAALTFFSVRLRLTYRQMYGSAHYRERQQMAARSRAD